MSASFASWARFTLVLQCGSTTGANLGTAALTDLINALARDRGQPTLWRTLGKHQLDVGEVAEAYRIFRAGALSCPEDCQLQHYNRVYHAFHGDDEATELETAPPLPEAPCSNADAADAFLSLTVPADSVPDEMSAEGTALVHASKQPLIPMSACNWIIASANAWAENNGGYMTDRHVHAPTCDVALFELGPDVVAWVRSVLHRSLFPYIAALFPITVADGSRLRCQDCFVVRYDGEGEGNPGYASLKPHKDESLVSLTIALNDRSDYSEGGLYVASTGDLLNGDAGTVLCFAGGLVHGGYPVARGTRWILTVFLYVDSNLSGRPPGYTLDELGNH